MKTHVTVVGGGIGGLTAALCLARKGLEVTVLERSAAFTEAGAGIQLSPNCVRVLHHLGLEQPLTEIGFLPQATTFRQWRSGKVIHQSALGDEAVQRYGAPYYHVHRGDLLRVLLEAASAIPSIDLKPGTRLLNFEQRESAVDLATDQGTFESDCLIGADGIHSVVRGCLWGDTAASFTGNIAWRALVPVDRLPPDAVQPHSTVWWGPGKHFVHYYVRGGELVNCVCVVEKSGWEVESWTEPGELSELKAAFSGWHSDIQMLIDEVEEDSLFKWALFDREPMAEWGRGKVSLLGDACHPTLPFMAQGAAMAMEDAAILANCFDRIDDLAEALKHYESLRKARTAGIQQGSRRNARVFHMSGIPAFFRNRAVRAAGSRAMDKLYQYDPLDQF